MYLLASSWKDALSMLRPRNLPLLFGSFWLTLVRTYRALFRYGWLHLIVFAIFLSVVSARYLEPTWYSIELINIAWCWILFAILLAIRPSVQQKDADYFYHHDVYFLPFYLGLLVVRAVVWLINRQGFAIIGTETIDWTPWDITTFAGPLYITPFLIFFTLFYLDSEAMNECRTGLSWVLSALYCVLKSLWRALKLLIITFPLTLLLYVILKHSVAWLYQAITLRLYAAEWLGVLFVRLGGYKIAYAEQIISVMVRLVDVICASLFWPIAIVPFAVLYIKWVHERFSFFFDAT